MSEEKKRKKCIVKYDQVDHVFALFASTNKKKWEVQFDDRLISPISVQLISQTADSPSKRIPPHSGAATLAHKHQMADLESPSLLEQQSEQQSE